MRALILATLTATFGCDNRPTSSAPPQPSTPVAASHDAAATIDAAMKPTPSVTPPPSAAVAKLARSSNAFGFDLYARVRNEPGNLVLSPASITTALAMTWGGARGETAEQMKNVLHFDGTPAEVMNTAGALARLLEDPSRPVTFRIANQLFGDTTYKFEQAYLEQTARAYGAALERLDFKAAHEAARATINRWVESKTEKRIVDLLPPGGVDGETRLVLVNAIYFLGDWQNPFEPNNTRPQPFYVASANKIDVPMMSGTESVRYAKAGGVSAIELPYEGGGMAMVIIVPDAIDGLAAFEKALDSAKLDAIIGAMKHERVWMQIPKFEIAPAKSISLGTTLADMGMPLAFDRVKADFTGMANPPSPADRLVIAKVFHKAFIRVDEKGTEAAAATAVSMARAGGVPAKPLEFKADRPFVYVIRDTASGIVLFVGRVADPSAK